MGNKSWFFGIVLSLFLHGTVILLVLLWDITGSRTPESTGIIYGELVSLSEMGEPGAPKGGRIDIETKPAEPAQKPQKEEVKQEEAKPLATPQPPEEAQEEKKPKPPEEKPKEKREEASEQEKVKAPVETPLKEPPKKESIPLETVKEKKPEKKEPPKKVAEKPSPPPPKPQKPQDHSQPARSDKASEFEETMRNVIKDVQKQVVLRDIQRSLAGRDAQSTDGETSAVGGSGRVGVPTGASSVGAPFGTLAGVYGDRLRTEIQSKWGVPANIPMDGSLSTKILFRIDERGRVLDARVEKSSGNATFDSFCLQAIYKASPLTPPPPELIGAARDDGLEVEFTNKPL